MTERTYPYTAWTLQPSFKPVQIEIVELAETWGTTEYEKTAAGKRVYIGNLFATKALAITEGRSRVEAQQKALDKRIDGLTKKRAALDKAEASK